MKRRHAHFPKRQSGFILPLTLAALVMLILIASYVGSISQAAIGKVVETRERVQVEYQLESAKAQILQILALTPRSVDGLGVESLLTIVPDGRTYLVSDHIRVQLQDLRGLLPLNAGLEFTGPARQLGSLLQTYGIPADTVAQLIDALYDYRDADPFHRINGAESAEYLAEGRVPPRNLNLQDVAEIYRVKGWAEAAKFWQEDDITQYISVHRSIAFNPNVAPARVIAAMTGLPLEDAQKIVDQKRKSPSSNIAPLLFPSLGDPFSNSGFVLTNTGPTIRVSLWDDRQNWAWQFEMQTTPDQLIAPWLIFNARQIPVLALSIEKDAPQRLPALSDIRPSSRATSTSQPAPNTISGTVSN